MNNDTVINECAAIIHCEYETGFEWTDAWGVLSRIRFIKLLQQLQTAFLLVKNWRIINWF